MSYDDESGNSIPYIDDVTTCGDDDEDDDEGDNDPNRDGCGHSLSITENYRHRNRSIRINNRSSSSVAPLAEIDFANGRSDDESKPFRTVGRDPAKDSVVRLVIKGWNSTVSIQGLDKKSSITLKRKPEKCRQEKGAQQSRNETATESPDGKKTKKKRWKMLTKSLMAKSGRHDRRGLDERYPKYVLLKNEEEEEEETKTEKQKQKEEKKGQSARTEDAYPKMVALGERRERPLKGETTQIDREKSLFHIKRTFKNKTNPLHVTDQTCPTQKQNKEIPSKRKDEDEGVKNKHQSGERTKKRKIITERQQIRAKSTDSVRRRGSVAAAATTCRGIRSSFSHDNVFNEIQGVLNETLHLSPDSGSSQKRQPDVCRPATCRFCDVMNQPYRYDRSVFCDPHRSTCEPLPETSRPVRGDEQENLHHDDLQNIQIGILSTFFPPPVMIMKTYPNDCPEIEGCPNDKPQQMTGQPDPDVESPSLIVSVPDLQIKSKSIPEEDKFQASLLDSISDKTSAEGSNNDGEKEKDESKTETTKYLRYDDDKKVLDNDESTTTTTCTLKTDEENKETAHDPTDEPTNGNPNLSLTEIGYKMYDNLTRLSLVREKEEERNAQVDEPGTGPKSPCNITLESDDSVIRIFVPKKFNFRILQSDRSQPDIRIGLSGSRPDNEEPWPEKNDCRKVVRQSDLWHVNGERSRGSGLLVSREKEVQGSKINLSIEDEKEVFLSIETRDKEEKTCERKLTKEMNVGTDDFDETYRQSDGYFKNLSPRKNRLLRNLKDKLEQRGKMIDHPSSGMATAAAAAAAAAAATSSTVKNVTKPNNDRPERSEIFLVRQISSGSELAGKSLEVSSLQRTSCKDPENEQLREYYCEDCFATMRIFQDENPSVKRMVNKFETIIQLESF